MKDESDLKERTKSFALRIIRMYSALPTSAEAQLIARQILRSGTSVGAHYREAKRARSNAEFISKLEVALQELDETIYWMELLMEAEVVSSAKLKPLCMEAEELVAIFVTVVKNMKRKADPRRLSTEES